jgi:hypothetical protein
MLEKNKEKEIEKRRANIKPDLYDIKKIQQQVTKNITGLQNFI